MKKKVIKPFNLDKYFSLNANQDNNCKVETKRGYPVKSLIPDSVLIYNDWSLDGGAEHPILAQLETPKGIRIAFYTVEGKFYVENESDLDLVLVEEQEIPSVTKEEFETHIEWFINHVNDTVEELGKSVAEYFMERLLQESVKPYHRKPTKEDAQDENVKYYALKLEGLEDIPNEKIAKSYVRDAVGSANKALGYSAKERNAFSWQKVWHNQGCFDVIDEESAKKIIEKCPEFPFALYYKSNITSDDHGEA